MKSSQILFLLLLTMDARIAWASDACSTRGIFTAADVTVSDGSNFQTESIFQSKNAAAIRHLGDDEQTIAVEGPLSWVRVGDKPQSGVEFHKLFALGHQYHALLFHFEEIMDNPRRNEQISYRGDIRSGISGDYPYGGVAHLVKSEGRGMPEGIVFEFPDAAPIVAVFSSWRDNDGVSLPFHVQIDDGERVFEYRYTTIDLAPKSPLWFFEVAGTPEIDQVEIYRLHRTMLAAHCLGDAALLAELSAPDILIASRGELVKTSNIAMHERFSEVFQHFDYTGYHDIEPPVIEISEASDLGWIGVNVRASGTDLQTGESFDDRWAWIMTVRKVDGVWLHTGNASSIARR